MSNLGTAIVWCSLQATLFAIIAIVIYFAARRFGPRVGATTALMTLMLLVGIAMLAFSPWPRWRFDFEPKSGLSPDNTMAALAAGQAPLGDAILTTPEPITQPTTESLSTNLQQGIAIFWEAFQTQLISPSSTSSPLANWIQWIGPVFLVGFTAAIVWRIVGFASLRRQVVLSKEITEPSIRELLDVLQAQLGVAEKIELRQTSDLSTAAAVGWRKRSILLPKDWRNWSHEERRVVLAHELAHIARSDFGIWMLAQLGVLIHFYHPLVHWFARRLRLEQELAADALAAELIGNRDEYLTTLTSLALRTPSDSLAWPVQAFLPVRSTFLRRIEMLRQPKSLLESRWAPATRRFSLVVLLLAGVLVCGVRTSPQQQAVAQPKSAIVERKVISLDPKWLMSDVDVFLKVQPGVLTTKPEFRELLAQVSELMAGSTTLHLENIEAAWSMFSFKDESMIWIVRTKEPHTLLADPDTETKEYRGHTIVPASKNRFGILVVDNRTLIIAAQPRQLGPYIDAISSNRPQPDWWNRWSKLPPHTVTIYADVEAITRSLPERAIDEGPFVAFAPVFRESEDVFVVLDLEDKTKLAARIKTGSKDSAARVRRTVDASVQLAQNMLDQFRRRLPEIPDARMREPMRRSLNMLGQLLASSKVSVKGVNVQLRASAGDGGGVALAVAAAMPAVAAAREAARRVQGINNMKQLGLALLIYESDHRHFPPAVLKKEGSKYPYSWRVAILPFIERPDLYKRYRFDEPWDSKNNKELLAEIPELYKSPVDTREGGYTSYFAPIGERTILNSEEGTRIRDVKDGTSNTILLVEAKREIPWTKPEDIDIDEQSISLGGWHAGDIFIAGFADGSVRTISNAVDPKMLQHLFDMKDGQDVNP